MTSSIENWTKLYRSSSSDVRRRAANGILDQPDDAPLDLLIEILTTLGNHGLGAKAETVLLQRKDADLVPKMIRLLESNEQFVRECACNILGHSGDFSTTPHLLRMLEDPKLMVRRAAGLGLAFLKDPSSVSALREQLKRHEDDDSNVIGAIQCALKSLGEDLATLNEEFTNKPAWTDPISLYMACVHERLAEHRDGFPPMKSIDRNLEVLFLPSFHPETLTQVSFDGFQTVLRMATMTSSVWWSGLRLGEVDVINPDESLPVVIDEICQIDKSVARRFWSAIDALVSAGVKDTEDAGLDGIIIRAVYRQNGSQNAFEAWSPESESPQGSFVGEVYKLAWKAVGNKPLIERLRQIKTYL